MLWSDICNQENDNGGVLHVMYSTRSSNTCTVRPFYTKKRKEKRLQVKIGETLQYQNNSRENLAVQVSKQYYLKTTRCNSFYSKKWGHNFT